jgi:hypothetical protein
VARDVVTISFPRLGGGSRLAGIFRVLVDWAGSNVLDHPPGIVAVEQPSGKQLNPALSYAVGVTMAALSEGVGRATGQAVVVETVSSGAWKRVACGRGDVRKPKPSSREEYAVLTWARTVGYEGWSWDEADAMGIADYARRSCLLEVRS